MENLSLETIEAAQEYDDSSDQQYHCGLQLIRELGLKQGSAVLDIGTGPGRLALHVARIIGNEGLIYGIERSPGRINIAKRRAESQQASNAVFVTGDGYDLSRFNDNFFDTVYLNSVIHWFKNKKTLLQEVNRVLKPGGTLGFTSQITNYPKRDLREIGDSLLKKKGYFDSTLITVSYPVTDEEVRKLLEQTGFVVRKTELRPSVEDYKTPEDAINNLFKKRYKNLSPSRQDEIRTELIKESKKIQIDGKIKDVRDKLYVIAEKKV